MQYRFTREVGVFIPRNSRLWLPVGNIGWARAPEEVLYTILHELSNSIGSAKSPNRVVIAHENEFFVSQSRLWYRTAWTNSPVTAALYDRELDNAIRIFLLFLDEGADKLFLATHRDEAPSDDLAAPEESYTFSMGDPRRFQLRELVNDEGFVTRVLLPYLAVRRALISCLAFRPGTLQATELSCTIGTRHLKCLMCSGCGFPCSAVLHPYLIDEEAEQVSALAFNLGDDYRFGRLTAATLANTSLLFLAAVDGFFDRLDLTLRDPLGSINGFAAAPFAYRASLQDGRSLAAMEIMWPIISCMMEFMKATEPRNEELAPIIRAVLQSNRWITEMGNDRDGGSSGRDS